MINHARRQMLSMLSTGLFVASVPTQAWSQLSGKHLRIKNKLRAYNGTVLLPMVDTIVSTLGVNSTITTITNKSNAVVTITKLDPGIVEHGNARFDVNASVGAKGITLKPGQRRMIVAQALDIVPKIA